MSRFDRAASGQSLHHSEGDGRSRRLRAWSAAAGCTVLAGLRLLVAGPFIASAQLAGVPAAPEDGGGRRRGRRTGGRRSLPPTRARLTPR
jgi:hypothetical protein